MCLPVVRPTATVASILNYRYLERDSTGHLTVVTSTLIGSWCRHVTCSRGSRASQWGESSWRCASCADTVVTRFVTISWEATCLNVLPIYVVARRVRAKWMHAYAHTLIGTCTCTHITHDRPHARIHTRTTTRARISLHLLAPSLFGI